MEILTRCKGSEHFGIKPYPIMVTEIVGRSKVVVFKVLADITIKQGHIDTSQASRYDFHPCDVELTEELIAAIQAQGLPIPVCPAYRKERVVRRVNTQDQSECPGFQKAWDPEVKECKDCREIFPDECAACRRACQLSSQSPEPPTTSEASPTPVKTASTPKKPLDSPFRKGTRADLMYEFIKAHPKTTVNEVAAVLEGVKTEDAIYAVKSYVGEWSENSWGGKPRNFFWSVTLDKKTGNIEFIPLAL